MEDESRTDLGEVGPLAEVLLPDTPLTDLLDRVAMLATRVVDGCTMAGVTLQTDRGFETRVHGGERSRRVDAAQYATDTGPCLEAFRQGQVVVLHDTAADTRWRPFCEAAVAERIRSALSVPMRVNGNGSAVRGTLNLYSEEPAAFDQGAVAVAEGFAQQAAILVANAEAYWAAVELTNQLQDAMESRATIEQAKGILMGQSGLTAEQAFELLVRASQRENRKLREIAATLVERVQDPKL